MKTVILSVELHQITCGQCGGVYAIAESYRAHKYEVGGFWNCPYCKVGWGFEESENKKLKKQLADEQVRLTAELSRHDQTRAALRDKEKSLIAAKGANTKLKRRASGGVCPCCNRTFTALARHMKTKHPEFASEVTP